MRETYQLTKDSSAPVRHTQTHRHCTQRHPSHMPLPKHHASVTRQKCISRTKSVQDCARLSGSNIRNTQKAVPIQSNYSSISIISTYFVW